MTIDRADTKKDTSNETIEVLYNKEKIVNTYLEVLENANKWDCFVETNSSLIVPLGIESLDEENNNMTVRSNNDNRKER